MRVKTFFGWGIFALLIIFMIAAFSSIMEMRFSPGDIYPHYSSKRSDPLGTRAFYESLEKMEGMEVSRNVVSLQQIKGLDNDTTLLLLGLQRSALLALRANDESPIIEAVSKGMRLVIVLNPSFVPTLREEGGEDRNWFERREQAKKDMEEGDEESEDSKKEKAEEENITEDDESFLNYVGFNLIVPEQFERPEQGWEVSRAEFEGEDGKKALSLAYPEKFPNWYSQFRFKNLGEMWTKVALVEGLPVVVERAYGEGKIVIASDAYFSSNESLWEGANTSFLWWLIGGKSKVVFDETAHGSRENGGIMKLIRRYRLHGFFIGLFIFLALLAWSSGSSLVPGDEGMDLGLATGGEAVSGEDASSGLIRLLRRSIPPREMLDRCAEVWKQGHGDKSGVISLDESQHKQMEQLLTSRRDNPKSLPLSEAYRKLIQVLKKSK